MDTGGVSALLASGTGTGTALSAIADPDGRAVADGLADGLADAEGPADADELADAEGPADADGLADAVGLAAVVVALGEGVFAGVADGRGAGGGGG